jgi:hypothetical protein
MVHAYPRARYLAGVLGQDVVLVAALVVLALGVPHAPLAAALFVAIPAALAWGIVSLHFPSRVEMSDDAITFHRYGRAHRFAWRDVARVRVRRFLVRDRVLVRLAPSSAWRGRYWILDSIEGFDALVRELERRAQGHGRERPLL